MSQSWFAAALPVILALFPLVSVLIAQDVQPQTLTANLAVRATVVPACTGLGAQPMIFDPYPQASPISVESSTIISVQCSRGLTFSIDAGAGVSYSNGTRQLTNLNGRTPSVLNYNLYTLDQSLQVFGSEIGGTQINAVATGDIQTFTVYGSIPEGQAPPLGAYMDDLVVTLRF